MPNPTPTPKGSNLCQSDGKEYPNLSRRQLRCKNCKQFYFAATPPVCKHVEINTVFSEPKGSCCEKCKCGFTDPKDRMCHNESCPCHSPKVCCEKKILDVCCGGRMFWFDKKHKDVLFLDKNPRKPKIVGTGKDARVRKCEPDIVMDFRKLDLPDNSFNLVVFDPPHFTSLGENSYTAQTYGRLDPKTWQKDIQQGFSECFRVLKPDGILVFKWNEHDIKVSEIIKLSPVAPLFGHISGKAQKTHWLCFMKLNDQHAQ